MNYFAELENAIVKRYGCGAKHVDTVLVEETFQGRGSWKGNVTVFALKDHPAAKHCYAWGNRHANGTWDIITVLEIHPVASAETAVRAGMRARATAPGPAADLGPSKSD